MYRYSLDILAQALLYSHGAMAVEFAQLAVGWCLDHPEAEAGYAQCISKIVCKNPSQAAQSDSVACVSYGECDCSLMNKDSNEYFQCIANAKCAACTSPDITPAPSATSFYGLETLSPGTYTFTVDGTAKTNVVPFPTATITDFITSTAVSTLTVTITKEPTARTTLVQTPTYKTTTSIPVTRTTGNMTESTAPTATAPPTCPSYCDCEPYGDPDAYASCLQQPECAGCGIPFPPLPEPVSEPTTLWQSSTTSSSTKPTPSCATSCDCSQIKDQGSEVYFQCITNPNCERCLTGGRQSGQRTYGK